MARIVVGMFDKFEEAQAAVRELQQEGFRKEDISLVANDAKGEYSRSLKSTSGSTDSVKDGAGEGAGIGAVLGGIGGLLVGLGALAIPGIGPVLAAGPLITALAGAGIGAAAGGLLGALVDAGIPEEQARYYTEGVKRGGTLVTVRTEDARAPRAVDILNRHNAIDVQRRASQWGNTSTNTSNISQAANTRTNEPHTRTDTGSTVFPIIEEELRVGKREVETGGVRVDSKVEEKPVQETVNLRQEHVEVERRPADRPATEGDIQSFKEGTMEMREHSEEPVVDKRARVVEEVVVRKDVDQQQQTIKDTVRRTDVDVQNLGSRDTSMDETDYRSHFTNTYGNTSYTYDQYRPYYEYGSTLGHNPAYKGWTWDRLEPTARADWERRNPNSKWDDFKAAIREGWERVTRA